MINNRQGGRRRGRGGGGGRPPSNNPSAGNRQDNRQRGNAAQLLEKYKGLARDMQMQGDRVQTEYFLQFADHYFRVLNESRARFDEQRRQRGDDYSDEDEDQEDLAAAGSDGDGRDEPEQRDADSRREDREPREHRAQRDQQRNGEYRQRGRRPEPEGSDEGDAEERIAIDSLPPAIAPTGDGGDELARAPRRRGRRPRDPGEEIAPAA